MSPACWRGCGLQQWHQPWDGAQGVSGAVGDCSLPALLTWVDWATPAMPALCLGWLGRSIQGAVLNPCHTWLEGHPLPSPGGGWSPAVCTGRAVGQAWCLDHDGMAVGGTWPRVGDSRSLACGRCAQQQYLAHHCLVLLHQKDQVVVLLLHCTLLLLQLDQPLAVRAPAEVQVQLQCLYRGQNLCQLQLLLLWVLACLGLPLLWLQHRRLPLALGHSMSSICLPHCCGHPILQLLPELGLDDNAGSPGFGQRAAMECVNNWWVQTSHPQAAPPCVCVLTVPPGS